MIFENSFKIARAFAQVQFERTIKFNKLHKSFVPQVFIRSVIY